MNDRKLLMIISFLATFVIGVGVGIFIMDLIR